MLKTRSIGTQFALVFLTALALLGVAFYWMLNQVYYSQLKSQAETVADNVDAFGSWVAKYGRVWVRDNDDSYLGHLNLYLKEAQAQTQAPASASVADQFALKEVNFFSKNPALAQREFSEVIEKSPSKAKFKLTSHNYMNPSNKPDAFEERALKAVQAGKLPEYTEVLPGTFRYARTVYHKAACITCHGDPQNAPGDVKVRYGLERGFGFKEGDVAGVISVRLPLRSFSDVALSVIKPWQLGLILLAFASCFVFIRYAIVARVQRLTLAAAALSKGQSAELGLRGVPANSRNEIHQLSLALDRLKASIEIIAARMRGGQKR